MHPRQEEKNVHPCGHPVIQMLRTMMYEKLNRN